jgi:hypothetical protein
MGKKKKEFETVNVKYDNKEHSSPKYIREATDIPPVR